MRSCYLPPLWTLDLGPPTSALPLAAPKPGEGGSPIQRTPYSNARLLHHMRVNHRRRHVFVAEKILNGSDIALLLQQMSREAMPQRVAGGTLLHSRQPHRSLHRPLHRHLVHMMPPDDSRSWIRGTLGRGKRPLPDPFPIRIRIFPRQSMR